MPIWNRHSYDVNANAFFATNIHKYVFGLSKLNWDAQCCATHLCVYVCKEIDILTRLFSIKSKWNIHIYFGIVCYRHRSLVVFGSLDHSLRCPFTAAFITQTHWLWHNKRNDTVELRLYYCHLKRQPFFEHSSTFLSIHFMFQHSPNRLFSKW